VDPAAHGAEVIFSPLRAIVGPTGACAAAVRGGPPPWRQHAATDTLDPSRDGAGVGPATGREAADGTSPGLTLAWEDGPPVAGTPLRRRLGDRLRLQPPTPETFREGQERRRCPAPPHPQHLVFPPTGEDWGGRWDPRVPTRTPPLNFALTLPVGLLLGGRRERGVGAAGRA